MSENTNSTTTSTASAEALHRLYEEYAQAVAAHDVDALVALHTPDFFMHTAQGTVDIEGYRAMMSGFFAAFPDTKSTPVNVVAEGDRLVYHVVTTGTHTGADLMGIPASGKAVEFTEIYIRRVEDGKFAEGWGVMDAATFMGQLQAA